MEVTPFLTLIYLLNDVDETASFKMSILCIVQQFTVDDHIACSKFQLNFSNNSWSYCAHMGVGHCCQHKGFSQMKHFLYTLLSNTMFTSVLTLLNIGSSDTLFLAQQFLCPHHKSGGAYRFAFVCPSVRPFVRSYVPKFCVTRNSKTI